MSEAEDAGRFENRHEERLTHRLEAFSDIVLGFSLAEMTINFAIPRHAIEVYDSTAIYAFAFTFLVVSMAWFTHRRLFEYYFVPRTPTIVLNFVLLGLIVWLVYQLQLYVHFAESADHGVAAYGYGVTFSIVWMLYAVLFTVCTRMRWTKLDAEMRRSGALAVARTGLLGAGMMLTLLVLWALKLQPEISFYMIFFWAFSTRFVGPLLVRKIA